jgi:hypothetical protein
MIVGFVLSAKARAKRRQNRTPDCAGAASAGGSVGGGGGGGVRPSDSPMALALRLALGPAPARSPPDPHADAEAGRAVRAARSGVLASSSQRRRHTRPAQPLPRCLTRTAGEADAAAVGGGGGPSSGPQSKDSVSGVRRCTALLVSLHHAPPRCWASVSGWRGEGAGEEELQWQGQGDGGSGSRAGTCACCAARLRTGRTPSCAPFTRRRLGLGRPGRQAVCEREGVRWDMYLHMLQIKHFNHS